MKKISYCLSAILYCLWLHEMRLNHWRNEDSKRKMCFHMADKNFVLFYILYWSFASFIFMGLTLRIFGLIGFERVMIPFAIPLGIGYLLEYIFVQKNDRYLEYFKEFEKKDAQWLNKWKKFTLIFCIGAILSIIFGIIIAFVILGMIG